MSNDDDRQPGGVKNNHFYIGSAEGTGEGSSLIYIRGANVDGNEFHVGEASGFEKVIDIEEKSLQPSKSRWHDSFAGKLLTGVSIASLTKYLPWL